MIYLDSCALVKLLVPEPESGTLDEHLTDHNRRGVQAISSELSVTEVLRALIRLGVDKNVHDEADVMLHGYATLPLGPVLVSAGRLPHPDLRSLDALHLATAQLLGPAVSQFITYDKRLARFASDAGMPVVMPGVN